MTSVNQVNLVEKLSKENLKRREEKQNKIRN